MANTFLNTAESLSGQDLVTAEETALQFAQLEPDFLAALQGVKGLSLTGMQAAMSLGQVFPAAPGNLTTLLSAEGGQTVQKTVNNINNVRCGGSANILEKIGELWIDAAAAASADVLSFVLHTLDYLFYSDAYAVYIGVRLKWQRFFKALRH
jgi:hypothetical protein